MKKRMISLLLTLIMATALILSAVPALAAQTVTVHVQAPSDWESVYGYIWESDIPMSDWPGSSMNNSGDWWTLEIPCGYTNIVINDGQRQTIDLKMDGYSDIWIVIPEVDYSTPVYNSTVYTDSACTQPYINSDILYPDYLAGLESLAITGSGIPGVSEWNPADPAGDMTLMYPGVYVKELSFHAGDTMEFKFAGNDMWDDNYNFGGSYGLSLYPDYWSELVNGGSSYDITFSADYDCTVRLTLNLTAIENGGAPILWIEDITDEDSEPEEMITVYAKVPTDWRNVRLWAWDPDTMEYVGDEPWPGELIMTLGDNGWYSAQIPTWATGVLINANGGSAQTPDITDIRPGIDIWIDAYTDYTNPIISYEEMDIPCKHTSHDYFGVCSECGEIQEHQYDSDYTCACGMITYDLRTVYFKKTSSFSNAYVYWEYDESDSSLTAPGVKMEDEGNNIYSAQVPANAVYLIFNDNWDTEVRTRLSYMTDTCNVFDPFGNYWITYSEAVPPVVKPPVEEPPVTNPNPPQEDPDDEQKPSKPSWGNNDNDDDDDDDDSKSKSSGRTAGDPSWIFITLASLIVVGMAVMLVLNLKKKN